MKPPGFGLGLTIAKRAIESHGGRIGVRAADSGGLVVEIVLDSPALKARRQPL